jgi:hypothetical protein
MTGQKEDRGSLTSAFFAMSRYRCLQFSGPEARQTLHHPMALRSGCTRNALKVLPRVSLVMRRRLKMANRSQMSGFVGGSSGMNADSKWSQRPDKGIELTASRCTIPLS